MSWLDKLPWVPLIVGALTLGLAPFLPEPHFWQKLKMLLSGELTRPLDIFDFILHGAFPALVLLKLLRLMLRIRG